MANAATAPTVPHYPAIRQGLSYGLLGLPLAFVALPLYVVLPNHYAREFGVPLAAWLRGPLREWAEALLEESRLKREGFFDPQPVRERWAEHLSGRRDCQNSIWNILMFQAWLEARQNHD